MDFSYSNYLSLGLKLSAPFCFISLNFILNNNNPHANITSIIVSVGIDMFTNTKYKAESNITTFSIRLNYVPESLTFIIMPYCCCCYCINRLCIFIYLFSYIIS